MLNKTMEEVTKQHLEEILKRMLDEIYESGKIIK